MQILDLLEVVPVAVGADPLPIVYDVMYYIYIYIYIYIYEYVHIL